MIAHSIGCRDWIGEDCAMTEFRDALQPVLPDDAAEAALAGRVWRPDVGGPSVVAVRDGDLRRHLGRVSDHARPLRGGRSRRSAARARAASASARWTPCWPTRRPQRATAPGPGCWRRSTCRRSRRPASPSCVSMIERVIEERARGDLSAAAAIRAEVNRLVGDDLAKLKPGSAEADAPEAGADRTGRLEPVSGGRHRPRRGNLHQGAADGRRRHRHGCRHPSEIVVEQPGARGRAGRRRRPAASSARRWATTSTCAMSRAARPCCSARRRTTTRPARSGRSSASSTPDSGWTTSAGRRSR